MIHHRGEYSADWRAIAKAVKERHGDCCERCGHKNEWATGYVLTVHHLDGDKANCADWNLAALCQRCHLAIQGKMDFRQGFLFDHAAWFKPHYDGWLAAQAAVEEAK